MPTKTQGFIVDSRRSKSLYTAVFYDNVPESSASSSTAEVGPCSSYLKRITREHLARASMEEVESSTTSSPTQESKERVAQLTERVKRAYSEANGNPADGRWSFISGLLQLGATRGGQRWLGVNTAAEAPEIPNHLSVIPKTNEEWHELERKWKEEENVKNKVQRWIVTAEFEPLTPEATVVREPTEDEGLPSLKLNEKLSNDISRKPTAQATLKKISTLNDPLSSGSGLGFSVVKRSNTIANGKPGHRKPQPSFSQSQAVSPAQPSHLHHEDPAVLDPDPSTSEEQNQMLVVDRNDLSVSVCCSYPDLHRLTYYVDRVFSHHHFPSLKFRPRLPYQVKSTMLGNQALFRWLSHYLYPPLYPHPKLRKPMGSPEMYLFHLHQPTPSRHRLHHILVWRLSLESAVYHHRCTQGLRQKRGDG